MKISIITVCWNSAKTIETAFASVLNQRYPEYEYLVVDGGSGDGTLALIKKWEPLFKGRMRWISERDEGMYDAINKGIRMATGDVVGILNADDVFASDDVLAQIADVFTRNPEVNSIFGDIRFVANQQVEALEQLKREPTVRYYSSKYFRPWLASFGYMPAHPTFYCKKDIFMQYGCYRIHYQIAADHELMIRFLVKNRISYKYVNQVFVIMRMGGMSTRSLSSTLLLNRENIQACFENQIYTNRMMQLGKYIFKIPGLIFRKGY